MSHTEEGNKYPTSQFFNNDLRPGISYRCNIIRNCIVIAQWIIFTLTHHIVTTCYFCLKERIMHFRYMYAEQPRRWVNSKAHGTRCSMPCIIVILEVIHWSQACTTANNGTKDFPAQKNRIWDEARGLSLVIIKFKVKGKMIIRPL